MSIGRVGAGESVNLFGRCSRHFVQRVERVKQENAGKYISENVSKS